MNPTINLLKLLGEFPNFEQLYQERFSYLDSYALYDAKLHESTKPERIMMVIRTFEKLLKFMEGLDRNVDHIDVLYRIVPPLRTVGIYYILPDYDRNEYVIHSPGDVRTSFSGIDFIDRVSELFELILRTLEHDHHLPLLVLKGDDDQHFFSWRGKTLI